MKEKFKKLETFNLGKELSRNELKKIVGGCALVTCSDRPGQPYLLSGNDCPGALAYCAGAHHGTAISCSGCT